MNTNFLFSFGPQKAWVSMQYNVCRGRRNKSVCLYLVSFENAHVEHCPNKEIERELAHLVVLDATLLRTIQLGLRDNVMQDSDLMPAQHYNIFTSAQQPRQQAARHIIYGELNKSRDKTGPEMMMLMLHTYIHVHASSSWPRMGFFHHWQQHFKDNG